MKTKLMAFTIAELIVVLLLSGFIFTIAMLVTRILQQQEQRQEVTYKEVLEVRELQSLLKRDAHQCKEIWVEHQQLFFDYGNYNIKYQFDKKYICRSIVEAIIHNDTFWLPTNSFNCEWQQEKIVVGITDHVRVESTFLKQPFDIIINKQYAQKTLLEL